MNDQHCSNCQYYQRHYTLGKTRLIEVYCGHCTYQKPKQKRPDSKACENYIPGEPPEDRFASKEYLNKLLPTF